MQQIVRSFADLVVRSPFVRWTWNSLVDQKFVKSLVEFRPVDVETVHEMMAGRYLLASKLVDSEGISPFAVDVVNGEWQRELQSFAWLRHFQDARADTDKRFARTLVLDWIGRNEHFNPKNWTPALTSVRVLNWLRHLTLLTSEATPEQTRTIMRSLSAQIQSLKLRGGLSSDPIDSLFTAIALVGASLCEEDGDKNIAQNLQHLNELLAEQIDDDGLHRSRNGRVQLELLTELVTVRQALGQRQAELAGQFGDIVNRMHSALKFLTLGNGEPAYFNGCGQLPVELVIAVQAQNPQRRPDGGLASGYGVLIDGASTLIADSGLVPTSPYSKNAHASGLSFEFSNGSDLIVGNCGPAPSELAQGHDLFRLGAAHSGPTIDGRSNARIIAHGPGTGRLKSLDDEPRISVDNQEQAIEIMTSAHVQKSGILLRRSLTLFAAGDTLVGQDKMISVPGRVASGLLTLRFHLAPGAVAERRPDGDIIQITLKSGAAWTFLWEGGRTEIDQSVRQSAYFGFFQTQQIVIESEVIADHELSWIFTRQNG